MKSIVITGSTRGIGLGLADALLDRGCQVTISGRSQASAEKALASLSEIHGGERLHGQPCEVTQVEQHEALWESAAQRFGRVDIWINNAGIAHPSLMLWEIPPEDIQKLLEVNILGAIYGCQVAFKRMLEQGSGHIYNMEGFGSGGRVRPGISGYATSKSALAYLTKALAKESENTAIKVSALRPGMVITDMILDQFSDDPEGLEAAKPIFNILADDVETIAPWMADKILTNQKSGATISWLSRGKIMARFLTAPFNKRDLFAE